MWHFTCKDSSDCGGHKNPVGVLKELYKLELISSGEADVKTPHLAAPNELLYTVCFMYILANL
jgi:hypothetical protein